MQPDNEQCRFGHNCRYLRQNQCRYFHPPQHHSQKPNPNNKNNCFNGPNCWYFKNGTCHFYHPPTHSHNSSLQRHNILGLCNNLPNFLKQMQEVKKRQQQEQRKRRQREQQQAENARLQILRLIQIQNQINATRLKSIKKSNPQNFQWYFGKNKTFKAIDISEEKLQQLDQCVICYASFTEENPENQSTQQQIQIKIESKSETMQQKISEKIQQKNQQKLSNTQKKQITKRKEFLHRELTELYCKHTFHKDCIKKWLSTTENCPICRKDFKEHKEYNKWEQEKKQLKKQSPFSRQFDFSIGHQSENIFLQRTLFRPFVPSLESDDDEMFVDEMDYADYEDGYDEYDMWDVDGDDDY